MRWILLLSTLLYFPRSLERFNEGWSDFNIYLDGPTNPDWLYPHYVSPAFDLFRSLPPDIAFALFYSSGVLGWVLVAEAAPIVGLLGIYPLLLGLESGNLTPILAPLCLSPTGSLLASLVKPYCLVFVALHAIGLYIQNNRREGGNAGLRDSAEESSTLPARHWIAD